MESAAQLRKDWKSFRSTLTADLTDMEQLEKVAKWWSHCPISKRWLDWDDPKSWPDPWELITNKDHDYSAIALGMEYTLLLSSDGRWNTDRVRVCLASDTGATFQHLVVIVDETYALNVEHARVSSIDELVINSRYRYDMKHHSDER